MTIEQQARAAFEEWKRTRPYGVSGEESAFLAAWKLLAEDAERIDWIERMANEPGGLLLHDGTENPGRLGLGLRPGFLSRTLREAIDDAHTKGAVPAISICQCASSSGRLTGRRWDHETD